MWYELTNKRSDEKTVVYAECHDQALVGDKTLLFRLLDKAMYDEMDLGSRDPVVDRGIALHKLIRLVTLATAGDGYLNFMGNEFGHPEWIDFPREGNGWSFAHARRLWSLADDPALRYRGLQAFDRAMVRLARRWNLFSAPPVQVRCDEEKKLLVFRRKDLIFALNFHPDASFTDEAFEVPAGTYAKVLDSDDPVFGGFGRLAADARHDAPDGLLRLYLPSRCALVLHLEKKEL
jgi:1,4-alpha-glucan branching enzyme